MAGGPTVPGESCGRPTGAAGSTPRWPAPASTLTCAPPSASNSAPTSARCACSSACRTWEPAAHGPFPGYCVSLTRTASGALVAITRFPHLCAHLSYDGGLNWDEGTILDYPQWANHQALEVEPEVVLVVYMGHIVKMGLPDTRILRLRVTGRGLVVDP